MNSNLNLFDRINVAQCAARRAQENWKDDDRFTREFTTAKMWTRYRIFNSTTCTFIEAD